MRINFEVIDNVDVNKNRSHNKITHYPLLEAVRNDSIFMFCVMSYIDVIVTYRHVGSYLCTVTSTKMDY